MRKLKLRVGGLELEYECEPEELPTIISSVLEAVGPELLQNGGSGRGAEDPPQAIEVYIREWPMLRIDGELETNGELKINGTSEWQYPIAIKLHK